MSNSGHKDEIFGCFEMIYVGHSNHALLHVAGQMAAVAKSSASTWPLLVAAQLRVGHP